MNAIHLDRNIIGVWEGACTAAEVGAAVPDVPPVVLPERTWRDTLKDIGQTIRGFFGSGDLNSLTK